MANDAFELSSLKLHVREAPPGVLYHYTTQAGLLGIVQGEELWATKIQYMNDASEFDLALRLTRQHLDQIINATNHPSEKSAATELRNSLEGIGDINIFAACFCENGDLLSQWRGYTGDEYGYAIGFDSEALLHISHAGTFLLARCIYDPVVQRHIIEEAVALCLQSQLAFPPKGSWSFHGPLAQILFACGGLFKDASFEAEQEWRLISPTILYHDENIRFRSGPSMVTPYYRLSIMHEGQLPISHVVVGPCPHRELAKSAVTALLMQRGMRGPLNGQQIVLTSNIPFRNW